MSGGSSRRRTGSSWHSSFSRLFSRSPSKEQEEGAKAASQRECGHSSETKKNETSSVVYQRKESNPLPELLKISVCENKNLSTEELNRSTTQEELKKASSLPSLAHESKTVNTDRQSKEGFFQYLGNLFGIASKSSYTETERSTLGDKQNKTGKDFSCLANHQESGHTEHRQPEIFVISTSGTEQRVSNKNEDINFVKNTSSGSQDLQKAQEQSDEASKKSQCELGAPAVTYATYRGSARIKQLLKKQAELEQEETPTSINSSTEKTKENPTINLSNLETTTTKTKSSLKNSNHDTKDDKKDSQANIFLEEMDLGKNTQAALDSSEPKDLTLLTEMETIKNCIEELVSVKCASVSSTPELSRNLLLEPVLLPKEASPSCQNIDPVKMCSENSSLVEKREEVLGETQIQLQSNNATIVGVQKGIHSCTFSYTETKDTIEHDFSSHSKVDSTDSEKQLLDDKCSCNSWTEDQLKLKSANQTLYLTRTISTGEAVNRVLNRNKDSHTNVATEQKEQSLQIVSPNAHLPLREQRDREELVLILQDVDCNKTDKVTAVIDLPTAVQPSETVKEVDILSKNGPESEEATESVILKGIQNSPNVSMTSETETSTFATHMPAVQFDHNAIEVSNTNTTLLAVEYENVESHVPCTSLEMEDVSIAKAVAPVDDAPQSLEAKHDSCHHFAKEGENETLIKTSNNLDVSLPPLEGKIKPLEMEKTRLINNTGSATMVKPIPPPLTPTEVVTIKNLVLSARQNDPLVYEMKNHSEAKIAAPASETKDVFTVSPSKDVCLPKGSPIVVESEKKSSSPLLFSPSLPALISNSFIIEDSPQMEDAMSKPVPNSEDQCLLEASCSSTDKQESSNQSVRTPAVVSSAEATYDNMCCDNIQVITKSGGPWSPHFAAETEDSDKISDAFLESRNMLKTKISSDATEIADTRRKFLPCSEEMKDRTGSCSLDPRSMLAKENLPVPENLYTCKPASPPFLKDISKLCSPDYETIDVNLVEENNSIPINSEDDVGKVSSNHKLNCLPSKSTSEAAYSDPLVASIAYDVEAIEPVKMMLGMPFTTQQSEEVHRTPSQQLNLHYLAAATVKNPAEEDDQAITALFTTSSSPFFEEPLKDVETGKQVQIKSQDLTVLFKKADEIVDAILHLAIEEIRSKQASGVCQTNDIKDNLLGTSLQKDQKTRKMLSESKEIQSWNSSLKHFNESCIRKISGGKGKDTLGTDIQDEKIPFDITDKIDLHSSIALKAKEIIDDVINAAKQKLTYNQHEDHLSKVTSQNINLGSKAEALERPTTETEFRAKLPKIIEKPLNLGPAAIQKIISEGEVANSSAPLYINSKEVIKEDMAGEIVANNAFSCQKNGDEWSDPTANLESSPAEITNGKNNKGVNSTTNVTSAGDNTSNLSPDNKSESALNATNEETEEQSSSCPFVPLNVLTFNSDDDTYTCISSRFKGECGFLGSLESNLGKDLSKYIFKEDEAAAVVGEEPLKQYYEIDSNTGYGNMKKACTVPEDKNRSGTQFSSESSVMGSSAKISLNLDFAYEEKARIEPGFTTPKEYVDAAADGDGAFSPSEEWEGNSSFTILYEGSLQDESYYFSTEEPEHPLTLSDFSLDNNRHLLMSATAQGKCESAHLYEEGDQFNKMLDNTCSESFLTVEAKRYRVYPFSLSPIYEDDSSQEDLLSTDISPRNPREKSRDSQSLSVLSLLQSVSERLQSSNQYNEDEEEELCEENEQDEKEADVFSHWPSNSKTAKPENIYERNLSSRHSNFLSKEALSTDEALSFSSAYSAQLLQKSDPIMKSFSKSVYHESLQSSRSYSGEKGTRFGSILLPKDQQPESNDMQKLATFQVCPVDRETLKCNPRPGKMVICDVQGNTNKHEIYHDVVDASAWVFSKEALIRVVRGCWLLYEKPGFQGQTYVVEEGEKMLNDILNPHSEKHQGNLTVGSIRQIVKHCSIPEIELYPQGGPDNFPICIQSAIADVEELEVKNLTLSVKAGVWLAYSDVNYKGEVIILEENHNPCEISAADVKSLYPLKMGSLKVQMPMNIKVLIYERPHFGGWCKELSENNDCIPMLFENAGDFQGIRSIRVIGGIWVGYEKERYIGQQYLLEEGEYEDWQSWGGVSSVLLSLRFLQADFMESEITLFETDEENGKLLNIVNQEIPDLEQAGFGLVTRSINVKSGAWVVYQQKYFCGEQYILEKGKYKCFFDWGGPNEIIMSIRPIKLEPLGNHEPIHWIKAFSNTHFQGSCVEFTTEIADFASFTPCSFKVLRGCWLLHYKEKTDDDHCVLEEDLYPDLASCGCPAEAVKSLKPVEYVFAEPFISLFALENCEGRELHFQEAVSSVLNKDLHFLTQSVWVRSGLWIAYEGCNFLGKQVLLEPSKISNWTQFRGWKAIGSLRPVKQPAVYFRIKNRSQDKYLTVAGNLMDARAASVCLSPSNGKNTQIWSYKSGLIKSKVNDACLDVIGGRDVPGAKVALWVEHGKARQKWTRNKDGTISSYLRDQLVLDVKGGYYYDRNHIIVNQLDTSECTQKWDFEIL
ncbi:very large A-kinase anchor protein [Elgaria multicarinata webbii]|uniref:very large A-kinase anchor protein n=1 Tax=Elgaria multicarinata webbii TaxID=159646 RepID=UPI002FCCE203